MKWKLVPVEPTEDMLDVAVYTCPLCVRERYKNGVYSGTHATLDSVMLGEIYKAMISAAPEAPTLTDAELREMWYSRENWVRAPGEPTTCYKKFARAIETKVRGETSDG